MMRYGIARFVGSWISSSGHRLRIQKVHGTRALVDFFGPTGEPVRRPYMDDAPSVRMIADYDDYNGIFGVELWERGKGFILDLTYEQEYDLDEQRRESLVPGLITYAEDRFLHRYSDLFPLHHFVRTKRRTKRSTEPPPRASVSHAPGSSAAGFAASARFRRRLVS